MGTDGTVLQAEVEVRAPAFDPFTIFSDHLLLCLQQHKWIPDADNKGLGSSDDRVKHKGVTHTLCRVSRRSVSLSWF